MKLEGPDDELTKMIAEARAAFPSVENGLDDFARFVAARTEGTGPVKLHGPDLWLACACARGDNEALAVFERVYLSQVVAFLGGARTPPSLVEEVTGLLRERLLVQKGERTAQIADYSGRGSLASWLRVASLRAASNLRRRDKAQSGAEARSGPEALAEADPELAFLKQRYRKPFEEALHDSFARLEAQERTILRLHFLDGLSIDKLGPIFQFSRATAARRLITAREKLLEGTLDLVRSRLKLDPRELESLMGLVRSQLEVSLRKLFHTG